MQAGPFAERPARARHRHELRTLSYVNLDQANGGIVRNLSHDGIAVQAVAAVRPRQQLRVRFELRYPKLHVEARGEVVWATFSGKCGIRFLDLSPRLVRQIDEWIFGNLLEGFCVPWEQGGPMLIGSESLASSQSIPSPAADEPSGPTARVLQAAEEDGLIVSPSESKAIALPAPAELPAPAGADVPATPAAVADELDWLFRPLVGRSLSWTVNLLVVVAALLLFVLVFLSVTREAPKWPFPMATGAAIVIAMLYWGFFKAFAGASLGTRLARLAEAEARPDAEDGARFR
jgi:hypothetical protein